MTTPRVSKTEAIILREVRLGEADRLLTLFTPGRGKVRAVARGALRPKSKLAGHLQPLSHTLLMLVHGRSMEIVTGGQLLHPFLPLRQDLMRLSQGLYICQLVDSFCPEEQATPPLFPLLLQSLGWLCRARDGGRVLRYFEMQLLTHLGYRPELWRCLACGRPLPPTANFFSPAQGGVLCPPCAPNTGHPLSADGLNVLRLLQEEDVPTLSRIALFPAVSQEIEGVMREYLQYLLEGEVKAGVWLDRLRREMREGTPN